MKKQFTLGKQERIKSRKQTELLFSEGKKFTLTPFRIHYSIDKKGTGKLLFGTGVSSKTFKRSVDRNRIKRLVREAYRLQKNKLQEQVETLQTGLNIFFIYTGKELPGYKEIYEKMGKVLDKLLGMTAETK